MSDDVLLVERTGHLAVLTLNRPSKLNALNAELRAAMLDAVASVRTDDDVRAVIMWSNDLCGVAAHSVTPIRHIGFVDYT